MEKPGRDRDPTERRIETTNLEPWEFPETEPSTKEHTKAGPSHHTYMQKMYNLDFIRSPNNWSGLSLMPDCGS